MRQFAPAPPPHRLRPALAQNFRLLSPERSAFETRPTRIRRGPRRPPPCLHLRNGQLPSRYSGHRLSAKVARSQGAASPVRYFRHHHTQSAASRAPRRSRTPGECPAPAFSFAAVMRASIPRAFAECERLSSRERIFVGTTVVRG